MFASIKHCKQWTREFEGSPNIEQRNEFLQHFPTCGHDLKGAGDAKIEQTVYKQRFEERKRAFRLWQHMHGNAIAGFLGTHLLISLEDILVFCSLFAFQYSSVVFTCSLVGLWQRRRLVRFCRFKHIDFSFLYPHAAEIIPVVICTWRAYLLDYTHSHRISLG